MADDVEQFVDAQAYRGNCPECGAETVLTVGEIRATDTVTCPNGHAMKPNASFYAALNDMGDTIRRFRREFGSS